MRFHKSAIPVFAAAILSCTPVIAAELQGSVPAALVKALIAGPRGEESRIYSGIPDQFPQLSIPAEFTVLGGVVQGGGLRLVLQTAEDREAAMSALTSALTGDGFVDLDALTPRSGGFVFSEIMQSRRNFCRDDVGFLTVMFISQADSNLVSLATGARDDFSSCEVVAQPPGPAGNRLQASRAAMAELEQHMPVINVPGAASRDPMPFLSTGGSSSSAGTFEISREFQSDMSVAALFRDFADQIVAQGWILDSEAPGQISASGNWFKTPADSMFLHGGFDLVQISENSFSIRFRLTRLSIQQ